MKNNMKLAGILLLYFTCIAFAQTQENKYVVTITYHIKQPEQSTNQGINGDEYDVTVTYTEIFTSGRERHPKQQSTFVAKSASEAEKMARNLWNDYYGNNGGTGTITRWIDSIVAVKKQQPVVINEKLTSKYNILASTATEAEDKATKQWETLKEENWIFDSANAERTDDIATVNPPQQETPKENKYRVDVEFWHDNAPPVGRIRNTMSYTVNASSPEEAKKKAEAEWYANRAPWWSGIISIKDPVKVD